MLYESLLLTATCVMEIQNDRGCRHLASPVTHRAGTRRHSVYMMHRNVIWVASQTFVTSQLILELCVAVPPTASIVVSS